MEGAAEVLGFHPSLQLDGPVDLVDDEVGTRATAVVREVLANIARNARSSATRVEVRGDGHSLSVVIEDDGQAVPGDGLARILARLGRVSHEPSEGFHLERREGGGARLSWSSPTEARGAP